MTSKPTPKADALRALREDNATLGTIAEQIERMPIDEAAATKLAADIMRLITEHYRAQMRETGIDRGNVYAVLNALAAATAAVLTGTGIDPDAITFFDRALEENLAGNLGGKEETALPLFGVLKGEVLKP